MRPQPHSSHHAGPDGREPPANNSPRSPSEEGSSVEDGAIEFQIVDPAAPAGEYRSAEDPGVYVPLADPDSVLDFVLGGEEIVIGAPTIKIHCGYPLETDGPSELEQEIGGWVFDVKADSPHGFTRRGLAAAIARRYQAIYAEEEASASKPAGNLPGMLNRDTSDGKYGIWGHHLGDLLLHGVSFDEAHGVWELSIDS